MNEITIHPNVYATGASKGLVQLLERIWVREHVPGDGTMFVVSGFGNYNGGVRFFETFRHHTVKGGQVLALFAGSTSARLTSKQVVRELLSCGAEVRVVNRKRLLHAKCYGVRNSRGESAIVTSGNFTGPGMSQNVEMSVLLEPESTAAMSFRWDSVFASVMAQGWDVYTPILSDMAAPAWELLYDEEAGEIALDDSAEVTLLLRLGHADTVRINATRGSIAGRGSQYFWLSKDCYDFFPPLTIRNERGQKATYSCIIEMRYPDLGEVDPECRVTFEAENNLDFRLGTGRLRHTRKASEGDLAAISRVGESEYELRLYPKTTAVFDALAPYALNFIGHQGKQYGFIPNTRFESLSGVRLVAKKR